MAFLPLIKIIYLQPVPVEEFNNVSWLSLLSVLNTFGGTLFSTGALLFVDFVITAFSPSRDMGQSIYFMTSLCLTSYSTYHSTGWLTQYNLAKCGPSIEAFSASVLRCFHKVVASSWWWYFWGGLSHQQI